MGIPVRRLDGGQAVFAYVDELDSWLAKKQVPPVAAVEAHEPVAAVTSPPQTRAPAPVERPPDLASSPPVATDFRADRLSRAWMWTAGLAVAGGLLLVVATFLVAKPPERRPARLVLDGQRLLAVDFANQTLWRHDFSVPTKLIDSPNRPDLLSWWELMDVDGDGMDDVTAVVRHPQFADDLTETLYVFALDGQLKYSYSPDHKMVFGERSFSGPYMFWDIEPVPEDKSIWVSFVHAPWWASGVVRIDGRGAAALRFTQPGLVRTVKTLRTPEGVTVLAGGVNNQFGSATVAVLDVQGPPANAPQKATDSYTCLNCPAGAPRGYLLLLPSTLSVAEGRPYNEVFNIMVSSAGVEVTTYEAQLARVSFQLGLDLSATSATPSDGYWTWKPRFDPAWRGRVGHPTSVPVRRWASGSWSEQPVRLLTGQ
jgi:hypothetical protein